MMEGYAMDDNPVLFDGSEDQKPLTPVMEALDRQLVQDAVERDAESPDTGMLATYARALAEEPTVSDSALTSGSVPAPHTPRLELLSPRQPSTWAAYLVTFGLVAAIALLLLWPSLRSGTHIAHSPTPTANATAVPTETPLSAETPTPRVPATATVGASSGGSSGAAFTVTHVIPAVNFSVTPNAWGDSNLTTISNDGCGQTVKIGLSITFDTSNRVNQGKITYRWHRSDGFVSNPISFGFDDMSGPPLGYAPAQGGEWDFSSVQADGSARWVDVEVLEPNPITARLNLQITCQFSIQGASTSVRPAAYNCTAGGDQTFTFTSTILASYAPGNHAVSYHWLRSDGSVTADHTITFQQGVISAAAQPDSWVIHQSDTGPGNSRWDQLVVTSPSPSPATSQQVISISCS